ncbi:hypothetical protein IFM89_024352 [Coptis chinensis]|uniref:Uncharacterized protein n=1 Tax=Coptis chinensis TaxID=261450 RepID=A0A835IXK2_9MAGN|nr:hypothetical protein IFM89_024352 [Coptis chinensis]
MDQSVNMGKESAVCEEMICPKPRRVGSLNYNSVNDSKAGMELLDIILSKGGSGTEHSINHFSSSPPFFCGSPPSRASNPLVQDVHFGDGKLTPLSPLSIPVPLNLSSSSSPSSLTRKGSCARSKFGHSPAPVRIEGFDCLNSDRRNRSVTAVA